MQYFTISKPSGLLLNAQRTDFNVSRVHFAKFSTKEDAENWIKENNSKFTSIETKLPVKLTVNKHSEKQKASRSTQG